MVNRKDFRLISLKILNDTFNNRRWVKESIENNMADIDEEHRDIVKVYELVYGILRNKSYIDLQLSRFVKKPNADINVQNILRIGWYQLKRMDSIPAYAAVNTCVELAKEFVHERTGAFINAVLRNVMRDKNPETEPHGKPDTILSQKYSYEQWMVRFLFKHYDKKAEAIMAAGNIKPPVYVKLNTLKVKAAEFEANLKNEGIEFEKIKGFAGAYKMLSGNYINTESFRRGEFYVQDLSSQALGSFVNASQEDALIDVGSAPGGKAAYMAIAMENKGTILAIESDPARSRMIEQTTARLGITNVKTMVHDASVDVPSLQSAADKVLVDAPCSALGIIRRHPEKKWCMTEHELKEFPKLQLKILLTAANWVKKGGELFYSTCTINPSENQDVIEKFLEKSGNFRLVPVTDEPGRLADMITGKYFAPLPGNGLEMDGFFTAKLVKKS